MEDTARRPLSKKELKDQRAAKTMSQMGHTVEEYRQFLATARDNLNSAIEFFDGEYLGAAEGFTYEALYNLRQARKIREQSQEEKAS